MPDIVFIRGLHLSCIIGVYPEEKRAARELLLDLEIGCDCRAAGASDELEHALDYGRVCKAIRRELEDGHFDLVETVAERSARVVLEGFPKARSVRVAVTKAGAVQRVDAVGVIVSRER